MPIIRLENFQQFQAINVLSDPGAIGGPVVIPNAVQIVFRWTLGGGKVGNVVLYGRTGGVPAPTVAQATAILAAITSGAQWTALAPFQAGGTLNKVVLRSVHEANAPIVESTGPGAGGSDPNGLPNEVAVVATLRTARVGARYRGRSYIPNWGATSLAGGNVIAAAAVTALQNWVNTWGGAISAQGYTHVLGLRARAAYTGATGTQWPARAATTEAVTAIQVRNNTWDTQRRRGLK